MIWIKIGLPLILMAFLLKKKVKLEIVLPLGAVLLAILFGVGAVTITQEYFKVFLTGGYWNLFFVMFFVILLGDLMEKGNMLTKMASIFLSIFGNNRIAAAASTAFIGFLPMPGGSLLSAPFVEKLLPGEDNRHKLALNYWYRHIWEYFWPLYSGMAWIVTVMHAEASKIFFWLGPMSLLMVISGFSLLFHERKTVVPSLELNENPYKIILISWPIILAVTLSIAFDIAISISVMIAFFLFISVNRDLIKYIKPFVMKISNLYLFFLVAGIVYFDSVVRVSNVANDLYANMSSVRPEIFVFAIPLVIGLLTGVSIAFISITFPILSPFLVTGSGIDMPYLLLAYLGGFSGVMLSPMHLCLIVTIDYFKTTMLKVYPLILRSVAIMITLGIAYYLLARNFL